MIVEQLFGGACPGLAQDALVAMARDGDSQVMRQILRPSPKACLALARHAE